jgi:hypothetical protein
VIELLDATLIGVHPSRRTAPWLGYGRSFNWALDREIITTSPIARMKLPAVE